MIGWSEMQWRMDRRLRGRTCRFQGDCVQGLNCPFEHSDEVLAIFVDEKRLKQRKLMVRCGFCVRGECKHGDRCWRGSGGCVPPQQGPDSDYDTAESASEDGNPADGTDGSEGRSELGVIGAGELVPEQFAAREEAWLFERGGGRPQSAEEPVAICGQGSFGALAEGSEEEDFRRRDDQQPRAG